jgi:hypothetical protein
VISQEDLLTADFMRIDPQELFREGKTSGASRPWLTAMCGAWLRQVDAGRSEASTRHGNSSSTRLIGTFRGKSGGLILKIHVDHQNRRMRESRRAAEPSCKPFFALIPPDFARFARLPQAR